MSLIKKEGFLFKSPPEYKLHKKSSWHNRYFVLVKVRADYELRNGKLSRLKRDKSGLDNQCNSYLMYWDNPMLKKKGNRPKGNELLFIS